MNTLDCGGDLTAAVTQLREALEQNEEHSATLQSAHDELAEKLVRLEADHVDFIMNRAGDAEAYEKSRKEILELRSTLLHCATELSKAEGAIVELHRELHLVEEQIAQQNVEHQQALEAKVEELKASHAELDQMRRDLGERNERVAELEDLLRAGLEREGEIARLSATVMTRDERITELEHRQTERQRVLEQRDELVAGKDVAIAGWKYRVKEVEAEAAKLQKDLKAALQSVTAKDMIIGVLRDKQRTAAYEKDEILAAGLGAEKESERKAQAMRVETEQLRRELEGLLLQAEVTKNAVAELEDEKAEWKEEREEVGQPDSGEADGQLQNRLEAASEAQIELVGVRQQLQASLDQLSTAQHELSVANTELEDLHTEVENHIGIVQQQEEELVELRAALYEAEESAEDLGDGFLRRAQQAEARCVQIEKQIEDLHEGMRARDEAVSKAMIEAEVEKATSSDLRSRLSTYTAEVDRLSLANAELKKQVEDVRRGSASSGIRLVELEKRVELLQEDKELLNVALESKELELTLLQRQLGKGTPATRPKSLAASTSRLSRPSAADATPMSTRHLSKSVSHTSLRAHVRAASVCATPTPLSSGLTTPRARAVVTPSPMPLGASSKHNCVPGRKPPAKKVSSGTAAMVTPVIGRRSSLPVLRGTSMDLGRSLGSEIGRVGEEDEA